MAASAARLPIKFAEVFSLTQLGIPSDAVKFKNVTLESSKFCVVREDAQISIIDVATKQLQKLPVQVESAIMNPVSKVIGLRAQGTNLQIYNLEMKSRIKVHQMPEPVLYWRWISTNTMAIVTGSSVFHWSMDGDAAPVKVFDRQPYEGQVQIINYRASADGKWLILGGIAAKAGGIAGVLQLYSVERRASQPTMDAHGGCFATVKLDGRSSESNLFCFTNVVNGKARLNIVEVGAAKEQAYKASAEIPFATEADFAVSMLPDNQHGILFIMSKAGFLFLFDIHSCECIFAKRVSQTTMFASVSHDETGGVLTVDQGGRAILFSIDEQNLVPYLNEDLKKPELGFKFAQRHNLGGAEGVFQQRFEQLMAAGNYAEAAKVAVEAPKGVLRTIDTIRKFQQARVAPGQPNPVLQYFSLLLQQGQLNKDESIELVRPVISSGKPEATKRVEDWIRDGKLEYSEELGDLLSAHLNLALSVYLRAQVPKKAIGCFLQLGKFDSIIQYARTAGFTPDYPHLLEQLHSQNRESARKFALMLIQYNEGGAGALITVEQAIAIFTRGPQPDVETTTSLLLDVLKTRGDRAEDAELQTTLLDLNLRVMPQVAVAILESEEYKFTHYDRAKVAQLCESVGLYQHALQHYDDVQNIKRVLQAGLASQAIQAEFAVKFFGDLTSEDGLEVLRDLMAYNMSQNIRLVVEVAKTYSEQLDSAKLIALFEEFDSQSGLYYYLASTVNESEDSEVVFKYIQAAAKLNQLREVERVCRENDHYDAMQVKQFLLEQNLKDPRPLIYVCDRHGYVPELTTYLYNNSMYAFIEAYVQKMNQKATAKVVGALLDLNCPEDKIRSTISQIRPPQVSIDELVAEVEERNRLRLLLPWLEARLHEGLTETALHNALAKVYVEINNNPQNFLLNNEYYDSKEVGRFCEARDPHLAIIAYKRAKGECDEELLAVTNKHGFYKDQARYLVQRKDLDLWAKALAPAESKHRRPLIDQVVATALPESRVADEVSVSVKAFMAADLPTELIELLERIVLHGSSDREFRNNRNLQNLLVLTAIKADPKRVMDYLNRLENYDGPELAAIAVDPQYELYEEAFFIYKKFECGEEAIGVLLEKIDSLERAVEFAKYWDKPAVWSLLAKAQLAAGEAADAIDSFLLANDAKEYPQVIKAAEAAGLYAALIRFLVMARKKVREALVDNQLIVCYAHEGDVASLEEFISQPNVAKLEATGDRCFQDGLYEAARVLFNHIGSFAKLAQALVRLERFQHAVEAARKANSIPTWKAVCHACVEAGEFRLAQVAGLNIVVFMEQLQDLVLHYERGGHFKELIALLEQGINQDRAHQGMFTQLGVLYAKYREEKLMEHINLFWSRLNIPTLLQVCQDNEHWPEVVFLYSHYEQFDKAIEVMIDHSTLCWTHDRFKEALTKANSEMLYRAVTFYVREQPLHLNDLLIDLSAKLDHARVISQVKADQMLPLVQKYLLYVQRENIPVINEAVNALYVEEHDHAGLATSIADFDQFDKVALAQQLEGHDLLGFRRISASLYKMGGRFDTSIGLSKRDGLWQDAMETVAQSGQADLAESLSRFFVDRELPECFAAMLFTCYELIKPDVVLELAWRHNLMDFAMPFMIQTMRRQSEKVNALHSKLEQRDRDAVEAKEAEAQKVASESKMIAQQMPFQGPLMITAAGQQGMPPQFGGQPPLGVPGMHPPPGGMGGFPHPSQGFPHLG